MSTQAPTRTYRSSQAPKSRAPPGDSTNSGSRSRRTERSGYRDGEIPLSAASSSQERSAPPRDQRRKSNVTFATLAPEDSISRVKSRPPSSGQNSRRTSGASKARSRASRTSSLNGVAWSGSGAPLTETNLERLNEAEENERSQWEEDEEEEEEDEAPASDEQEVAQSSYRASRRAATAVTGARSSRKSRTVATENVSGSRSREQATVAASQYVSNARTARSGNATTVAQGSRRTTTRGPATAAPPSGSQSRSPTQSGSRKDSMSPEGSPAGTAVKSRALTRITGAGTQAPGTVAPGTQAPSESAAESASQQEASEAASEEPQPTGTWERTIHISTKRWPDGREVREREIKLVRPAVAA